MYLKCITVIMLLSTKVKGNLCDDAFILEKAAKLIRVSECFVLGNIGYYQNRFNIQFVFHSTVLPV